MRIKLIEIDGEQRVPPRCMDLLLEFAAHRDLCDQCTRAHNKQNNNWCVMGIIILQRLCEEPEVEP